VTRPTITTARTNFNQYRHSPPLRLTTKTTTPTTTALGVTSLSTAMPRLTEEHLKELDTKKFVIIPDFLSSTPLDDLRSDVLELRNTHNKFKVAKIGQDATNELNTNIRVAETCFIGPTKTEQELPTSSSTKNPTARSDLYKILDQVRVDLCRSSTRSRTLDAGLTELLYAYYPKGGYYRRHVDAVSKSASVLRSISLLLYLNPADWNSMQQNDDGGQLRIHLDSNKDELPLGQEPNYVDVEPRGGTLILFESDAIPHEVLDTNRERMAVVGWYNRPVSLTDIADLAQGATGIGGGSAGGGDGEMQKTLMLAVAAALVTVGVVQLLT
jgi:SM-20-related protein